MNHRELAHVAVREFGISSVELEVDIARQVAEPLRRQSRKLLTRLISLRMKLVAHGQEWLCVEESGDDRRQSPRIWPSSDTTRGRTISWTTRLVCKTPHELVIHVGREFLELLPSQAGKLLARVAVGKQNQQARCMAVNTMPGRQYGVDTHARVLPLASAPSAASQSLSASKCVRAICLLCSSDKGAGLEDDDDVGAAPCCAPDAIVAFADCCVDAAGACCCCCICGDRSDPEADLGIEEVDPC